jgi:hypothetical protein
VARARNIKPSIMDNEALAELEPLTRLLFVYLWMLADRDGRLEDRPKRIAAQALPYDRDADVGAMLDELSIAGFITRYEACGKACIQIVSFIKHQTPHGTEKDGGLPDVNGFYTVHTRGNNGYATGESKLVNGALTVNPPLDNALNPDSGFLNPDSGLVAAVAAQPPTTADKKSRKTALPADFEISERVRKWAAAKGIGRLEEHLEAFKRKCAANDYRKVSWDDAFMEAIREDWAKLRGGRNGVAPAGESTTVPMHPDALYVPPPRLTPEELAANKARGEAQLAALKAKGLNF